MADIEHKKKNLDNVSTEYEKLIKVTKTNTIDLIRRLVQNNFDGNISISRPGRHLKLELEPFHPAKAEHETSYRLKVINLSSSPSEKFPKGEINPNDMDFDEVLKIYRELISLAKSTLN